MKNILLSVLLCLCAVSTSLMAEGNIIGFWKSIDDVTHKAQSIVAIYEYQGKYFGRLIVDFNDDGTVADTIYDPQVKAPGVVGEPFYAGMDFIWNLKQDGTKYIDGSILDPEKGDVYGAEVWRQGDDLIVRGELLFFGRNQTWPTAKDSDFPSGFKKPDLKTLVPVIPVVK